MDAPDPEGMSLLAKVISAGVVLVTPIWGFLKLWDKKADKHVVKGDLQRLQSESDLHRQYFKDVFKSLEDHSRRDEELFREVMRSISTNHSELLRELGRKADR